MKISTNDPCPCHSGLKYKKCCRVFHNGTPAPTPEALMRSRYSAYALNKPEYIIQTTHPESRHWRENQAAWRIELEQFSTGTRFAGLQILAATEDMVMFRAILFQNTTDVSFTENSLFRQKDGRWLYLDGK
jgi:SEC-C motif-containing protein